MEKVENKAYLEYADIIFSALGTTKEGTGCFAWRNIENNFRAIQERPKLEKLRLTLHNLCVNGFLDAKDGKLEGWINLTQSGADYLAGGPLTVNKVDFKQYVDLNEPADVQFNNLWSMIGEQGIALFYIKGPTFLNMIKPYIKEEYIPEYMQYMEDRRKNEQSTSRRIWYRELYKKLPSVSIPSFLDDISYAVKITYFFKEDDDLELKEYVEKKLEQTEDLIQSCVPELPSLQIDEANTKKTPDELFLIAMEICNAFKGLIENNRMYKLLYNDDDTPKDETASQLLFYSIAMGFCKKYDVDINRESDPGIGELDFKFSVGNRSKVVIEMKLSTNGQLIHGYEKQLPAYLRAEDIKRGILVVIQTTKDKPASLKKIEEDYAIAVKNPNHEVDLVVIDATPRPSASKL